MINMVVNRRLIQHSIGLGNSRKLISPFVLDDHRHNGQRISQRRGYVRIMAIKDTRWMTGLALRENLLQSNAPHVPILVEDLPKYVSLIDYEENCVKMVHTIGKIGSTFISSITPGTNVDFPFSTDYMSPADMYEATDECTLFQKWTGPVAKVFGFLQQKNDSIVLMATRIIDVEDVKGSWETIMVLSRLVRRQYQQYYRSTEADESLKEEWDSMHRERRRK